jgi:hypothetical protein
MRGISLVHCRVLHASVKRMTRAFIISSYHSAARAAIVPPKHLGLASREPSLHDSIQILCAKISLTIHWGVHSLSYIEINSLCQYALVHCVFILSEKHCFEFLCWFVIGAPGQRTINVYCEQHCNL